MSLPLAVQPRPAIKAVSDRPQLKLEGCAHRRSGTQGSARCARTWLSASVRGAPCAARWPSCRCSGAMADELVRGFVVFPPSFASAPNAPTGVARGSAAAAPCRLRPWPARDASVGHANVATTMVLHTPSSLGAAVRRPADTLTEITLEPRWLPTSGNR